VDATRTALKAAGERRTQAVADATAASSEVNRLIRKALSEGVPKAEVARLAGVSRTALYKMLS
jgi:DNA invertase Pin-like site-specific DNA recombinase